MAQLIGLVLIIILGKLILDLFMPAIKKSRPAPQEDYIDITEKWINTDEMPYQRNDHLLDEQEMVIFQLFQDILLNSRYTVYPHLRLADLLNVPPQAENRQEYLYRIKERSLDMAILELPQLKPILVINLEAPGKFKKKTSNDRFTENALKAADLKSMTISLNNPPSQERMLRDLRELGLQV